MTGNNPKLDFVNINDEILSICSKDIQRNQNSGINQGP